MFIIHSHISQTLRALVSLGQSGITLLCKMAAQATPESSQGEVRSLFGGAFTCRIPSHYMDISAVRDIPDHQEVMAEEGPAGRSVIVELLQYQADVPDHEAPQCVHHLHVL